MAVLGSTTLTGCSSIPDFINSGSRMIFRATNAPTSWTKNTAHNNKALRVINGTTLAPGGTTAFTSVFTGSRAVQGTIGQRATGLTVNSAPAQVSVGAASAQVSISAHTLALAQIPAHGHPYQRLESPVSNPLGSDADYNQNVGPAIAFQNLAPATTGQRGSGQSHTHGVTNPNHPHPVTNPNHPHGVTDPQHNHTFTGTAQNFAVLYVDIIFANKN
jgi:hypothetical protein